MDPVRIEAPAKVNLYLHVNGKRSDGYHLLDSLIVCANDVADVMHIREAEKNVVSITGPFAHLVEAKNNNLLKLLSILDEKSMARSPLHIELEKNVPVGAGLGGGTADVASLLKHLIGAWSLPLSGEELDSLLLSLGADVPACFQQKAVFVNGIGEQLTPVNDFQKSYAVLVYPHEHISTKAIFTSPHFKVSNRSEEHIPLSNIDTATNDLTDAAIANAPVVKEVLDALNDSPAFDLVRMTGTGSCCFGLTQDMEIAADMAQQLETEHPEWWVKATSLS